MSKIDTFRAIVDGFKNLTFPTKEHEAMAMVRAEICATSGENGGPCDQADPEHVFTKYIPGVTSNRGEPFKAMGCKLCGCYLPAKTRSALSSCPKDLW